MSNSNNPALYDVKVIKEFTETVFKKLGVPSEDAMIAADVIIEGDLRGFSCHGVARLFWYYSRLKEGLIEAKPDVNIEWLAPVTGHCDGGNGLGMVVGSRAMKECISRAKEYGAAFLTVNRSNHFGIAGYYSSMALAYNMVGIALTNASPRVVPTGGKTGVLGTNPISVSIPRKDGSPYILDMSTSVVSSGKIDDVVRMEKEVPDGWVYPSVEPFLDSKGVVPMSVLQYPLGGKKITSGYKGYGLSLLVDILCGVLSGANFGSRLAESQTPGTKADIGHFFGAMQISGFRKEEDFYEDLNKLFTDITSSPLESGTEKILIPGEPEIIAKEKNEKKGIPILPLVREKLCQIASDLGIEAPFWIFFAINIIGIAS